MNRKTVLISGASIAGPVLAFWLHRFGFEVTVVERAAALRLGGQNIDVRGAARTVLQRMGLEEQVRKANTGEVGVRFVDSSGRVKVEAPMGEEGFGTSELEILRGDLASIFYDSTKKDVEYLFGDQITALDGHENVVKVTFKNGPARDFNLVIAADGIRSGTRRLMFGDEPEIRFLGLYNTYMTISRTADDDQWARWYNATGSRVITLRPDNHGTTRASFSFLSPERGYERLDLAEQKELLRQKFADAGWQAPRILKELDKYDDLYLDGISQVIAPRWSEGKCAMVGDAAYCPSPLSGMGASLSIVGAYVLAGELSRHKTHTAAFNAYEKLMRPYVTEIQNLPPGVPWAAHPKTKFGIAMLNLVLGVATSAAVKKLSQLFSKKNKTGTDDKIALPEYMK